MAPRPFIFKWLLADCSKRPYSSRKQKEGFPRILLEKKNRKRTCVALKLVYILLQSSASSGCSQFKDQVNFLAGTLAPHNSVQHIQSSVFVSVFFFVFVSVFVLVFVFGLMFVTFLSSPCQHCHCCQRIRSSVFLCHPHHNHG